MSGFTFKPTVSAPTKVSIAGDLVALVLAILVPFVALAGLYYYYGEQQQQARQKEFQESARLIRVQVDNELGRMYDLLRILESSDALRRGDLLAFRLFAKRILAIRGAVVVLRNVDGQQLVNTEREWGEPLPLLKGRLDHLMVESGGPIVSNLITSDHAPVLLKNLFVVSAPIKKEGVITHFLSLGAYPDRLRDILLQRNFAEGEISVVGDSEGRIIARSVRHAESVGKHLPDDFMRVVHASKDGRGFWKGINFEGIPIVTAFELSRPFDNSNAPWIVSLGMTRQAFDAPQRSNQIVLGAFGLATWTLAVAALFFTGRRLARKFNAASAELHDTNTQLRLVLGELNHRVKNMLARIQSFCHMTARSHPTFEEFKKAFEARVISMARTHDLLVETNNGGAQLARTLLAELEPYCATGSVTLEGEEVALTPRQTSAVGMVVHELTTNAIKYGALATPGGKVTVRWTVVDNTLDLLWEETTEKPCNPVERQGFGTRLITQLVRHELLGTAVSELTQKGWCARITFPLSLKK